jgi:hypothetical protein
MGFFDIFNKKKERTMYDEFQETTVKLFRNAIGNANGIADINTLSDEKILEIAQEVMTRFKDAAEKKGETILGGYLLTIAAQFIVTYAMAGEKFYYEHLNYEINKYMTEGLREDYKHNLI